MSLEGPDNFEKKGMPREMQAFESMRRIFDQSPFFDNLSNELTEDEYESVAGSFTAVLIELSPLVAKYDLDRNIFLQTDQNEEISPFARDFLERFERFYHDFEERLKNLEKRLKVFDYHNFPDNWRDLMRRTAYFAFFSHYGAKRKYDLDEQGLPKDYIDHPINVAFDSLLSKMQFFDMQAVLAALLHDASEDWYKGGVAVLCTNDNNALRRLVEDHKSVKLPIKKQMGADFEADVLQMHWRFLKDLQPENAEGRVDEHYFVDWIVAAVTKDAEIDDELPQEIKRAITSFDYADRLGRLAEMDYHLAARVWAVKEADRLHNGRDEKSILNMRETQAIFVELARLMGSVNVIDNLVDCTSDQAHRLNNRKGALNRIDLTDKEKEIDNMMGLKANLEKEFFDRMQKKIPGQDVHSAVSFLFRNIGWSYRPQDVEDLDQMFNDWFVYRDRVLAMRQRLNIELDEKAMNQLMHNLRASFRMDKKSEYRIFSQRFRSCLAAMTSDPALAEAAEETFEEIFAESYSPEEIDERILRNFDSLFVRTLAGIDEGQYADADEEEKKDLIANSRVGKSANYGPTAFRVFATHEEVSREIHGGAHYAIFFPYDCAYSGRGERDRQQLIHIGKRAREAKHTTEFFATRFKQLEAEGNKDLDDVTRFVREMVDNLISTNRPYRLPKFSVGEGLHDPDAVLTSGVQRVVDLTLAMEDEN